MRKILVKETGEIFNSIAEATEHLTGNARKSNIRVALTDKKRHNRAYGYTFYYIESIEAETILREMKMKVKEA